MSVATDLVRIVRSTLSHVVLTPIQDGLPQPKTWPVPLRWIFVLSAVVIGAFGVVTAFGPRLRAVSDLVGLNQYTTVPQWSVSPLLWGGVFALTLLFGATLRTHWVLTLLVWIGVAPQLVLLSATGGGLGLATGFIAALSLAILPFVVRRRRWHVSEIAIVWLLLQMAVLLPQAFSQATSFGVDPRAFVVLNMQQTLTTIATPALVAAGYAGSELTVTTAQWLTHDLRQLGTRHPIAVWLLVAVLATGGWRGWTMAQQWRADDWRIIVPGAITAAVAIAITVTITVVLWRSSPVMSTDRRSTWPTGQPSVLAEMWNPWTLVLGGCLAILLIPANFLIVLTAMLEVAHAPSALIDGVSALSSVVGGPGRDVVRALTGVVMVVVAWRRSRQGNAGMVLLAAAMAPLWASALISKPVGRVIEWRVEDLTAITSVAALAWLVWAAVRRTLHNGTLVGIWVIWLLPQLYGFRQVLSDPADLIGQLSPAALVLVGLLWRLTTDGALAREHSKAFPQVSRVLLLLANTTLGMLVLMLAALGGGSAPFDNTQAWAALGEDYLGAPLLLAASLAPFLITFWSNKLDDERGQVTIPDQMRLPVSGVTPWPNPPASDEHPLLVMPVARAARRPTKVVGQMGGKTPTRPPSF